MRERIAVVSGIDRGDNSTAGVARFPETGRGVVTARQGNLVDSSNLRGILSSDIKYHGRVLSNEEKEELGVRHLAGDEEATRGLVNGHLRLVAGLASERAERGGDFMELFQEGCEGLLIAMEKWDPGEGAGITHYARRWVEKKQSEFVQENAGPGSPHSYRRRREVIMAETRLQGELGRTPSVREVALESGVSPRVTWQVLTMERGGEVSLDEPNPHLESGGTRIESIEDKSSPDPEQYLVDKERRLAIQQALAQLSPHHQRVLKMRFGEDMLLREISERLGLKSRERPRQIINEALGTLRQPEILEKLSSY